eukprot:TRINITY_DN3801_c0_g1_i1.p1 TRINITY_DN3801_c0_g1~~TRINITY_DN3801_c0_g1_i1.p1  ORF type:complete len:518 (-),score=83.33 TRINITY_DN3801_c0_g1_i1:654-2207(-)
MPSLMPTCAISRSGTSGDFQALMGASAGAYGMVLPQFFPPGMQYQQGAAGSNARNNFGAPRSGVCASRHMAAEQRRRARINDGLDALRSLVPHTARANTAAFLSEIYDYITALHKQLERVGAGVIDLNVAASAVDGRENKTPPAESHGHSRHCGRKASSHNRKRSCPSPQKTDEESEVGSDEHDGNERSSSGGGSHDEEEVGDHKSQTSSHPLALFNQESKAKDSSGCCQTFDGAVARQGFSEGEQDRQCWAAAPASVPQRLNGSQQPFGSSLSADIGSRSAFSPAGSSMTTAIGSNNGCQGGNGAANQEVCLSLNMGYHSKGASLLPSSLTDGGCFGKSLPPLILQNSCDANMSVGGTSVPMPAASAPVASMQRMQPRAIQPIPPLLPLLPQGFAPPQMGSTLADAAAAAQSWTMAAALANAQAHAAAAHMQAAQAMALSQAQSQQAAQSHNASKECTTRKRRRKTSGMAGDTAVSRPTPSSTTRQGVVRPIARKPSPPLQQLQQQQQVVLSTAQF